MSTRAQIIITDDTIGGEVWFYRHSDGYPEGTMPTLEKFLGYVKEGLIRANVSQAAGWLVILGHTEYERPNEPSNDGLGMGWKVGAYEPCPPDLHWDIEYLYKVNLTTKKITITTGARLAKMQKAIPTG